jgi:hypothetical protein
MAAFKQDLDIQKCKYSNLNENRVHISEVCEVNELFHFM